MSDNSKNSAECPACAEDGSWAPIPEDPPDDMLCLHLKDVDENASKRIREAGAITFHTLGCSGCYEEPVPGRKVAEAMAAQISEPRTYGGISKASAPSFLFHLGDISYKAEDKSIPGGKDWSALYNTQFYAQYQDYCQKIFAIPGNHDGKMPKDQTNSAIVHFIRNFCDPKGGKSPDNNTTNRKAMRQPYPYWRLETPVAVIVGLYTNDVNGGQLDNPQTEKKPQYRWLVRTLSKIKQKAKHKALVIALHYPPYSGAANFGVRGNPNVGPNNWSGVPLLGVVLRQAYQEADQYPDLVLSAHAHLYQRITYQRANGQQIPHLIVGSGGHSPVEKLFAVCEQASLEPKAAPLDLVVPLGLTLPSGDKARVVAYNDTDFGFARITIDMKKDRLTGEFFTVFRQGTKEDEKPKIADSFKLNLKAKRLTT
jgi:acid phosphatase type 7